MTVSGALLLAAAAAAAEGRPLFYWGARPAVIAAEARPRLEGEAQVLEVHAALDAGSLLVRFSFDRRVREALYLPDGKPVSGRLRAVLYFDVDDDPRSGLDAGPDDPRRGAEHRLELGVVSIGADPAEGRAASALVTASLARLRRDGRQRTLWRGDDSGHGPVSAHGDWVEVRIPAGRAGVDGPTRMVLAVAGRAWEGRFTP